MGVGELEPLGFYEKAASYLYAANYILFRVPAGYANAIFNRIKQRNVLINNMKASEGPLADCLRVTVGTVEVNEAFLRALKASL